MIAGERAINAHLQRRDVHAHVKLIGFGYRIHYDLPDAPPLVSIVIPTRNNVDHLRKCIHSLLSKTTYPKTEILIVDNGSDEEHTRAYLDRLDAHASIRILRDPGPFNYSALNNAAVKAARGDLICLLNDDTEAITPDWLQEMAALALQPGVGAVGARLWYPDDTLQHGGLILGILGVAGNAHKHMPKGHHGYFGRAGLTQSLSAVTAACLVVQKSVYEEVGGLNETDLQVAYNDVDFCLRLREAGYRNVWTPNADLYHHESASRGSDTAIDKQDRFHRETRYMKRRWEALLADDPAYNPNLTLERDDFSLAWPPRQAGL
jgi:GT2 family glycosyltransferase